MQIKILSHIQNTKKSTWLPTQSSVAALAMDAKVLSVKRTSLNQTVYSARIACCDTVGRIGMPGTTAPVYTVESPLVKVIATMDRPTTAIVSSDMKCLKQH